MFHPGADVLALFVACAASLVAQAQEAPFRAPDGSLPARRQLGYVVDCASHGGWTAPEGWSVVRVPTGDVAAIAPGGDAILLRVQTRTRTTHVRSTEDFQRIAAYVVSRWAPGAVLGAPTEHARSRWHVDRRIEGTASVSGRAMRVIADSRGERQLWVALSPPELSAAIDAAMASYLPLVDHACACGYDCDRPARRAD